MGTHWKSGLIYWTDHISAGGERYALKHLHPFARQIELAAGKGHPARSVRLHISFGLHTFTHAWSPSDSPGDFYGDDREVRTFCVDRYRRSHALPDIFRSIELLRCEFARGLNRAMNYVVIDTGDTGRYAAFFDLRRLRSPGGDSVHLLVQSAYVLDADKPAPGSGRIHFHALLGHVLRGTTPRRPV